MKLKLIKKTAKNGVLAIVLIFSGNAYTATQQINPNQVKTIDTYLSEIKSANADQKLVNILSTFLCDFNVKGHFSKFITALIVFLENEVNAAQLKAKFPTIKIDNIIAMLDKVKKDTIALTVAWKLSGYMGLFPPELKAMLPPEVQNMGAGTFTMRISKRLSDKS